MSRLKIGVKPLDISLKKVYVRIAGRKRRRMNNVCELCGGACCKSFGLPLKGHQPDIAFWLSSHGEVVNGIINIKQPCKYLDNGKCGIYDRRPVICSNMPVGGKMCLLSVKLNAPEEYEEIVKLTNGADAPQK
jgi:Fe-S-cluster containining protein